MEEISKATTPTSAEYDLDHGVKTPKGGAGTEVYAEPVDPRQAKKAKNSDIFTVLASGAALISDGYQNNLMTMTNVLFGKRYGSAVYTSAISTRVSNALLVGAILGQVCVGVITDRLGRKSAIVTSTLLLSLGAIFATAAYPVHGNLDALWWWLIVARGAIGVGVGGEYPASSTSASEAANERYCQKSRSTVFILVTNLMLSFGGPLAVSIFLIVLSATKFNNTATPPDLRRLDITWRVCFGIGILLPLTVFYFRWKILNSKLYRVGAIRHNVPYWLALKRYWPRLLGTASVWFLYDIVSFSNGVFSGTIISTVINNPTLKRTAEYQLLLGAIALPGVLLGAYVIRSIGSRYLLILGFTGYIIFGVAIGASWDHIIHQPALFVVLYGLLASSGNLGPGNCCGLVSSESFPTALRGTAYGFSAAIGKTGAAVGTQIFRPVQDHLGKKWTFFISAIVGVVGVIIAWFLIIDTTKLDLAEEDAAWMRYLVENGWNGELGDGTTETHKAADVVGNTAPVHDGAQADIVHSDSKDASTSSEEHSAIPVLSSAQAF